MEGYGSRADIPLESQYSDKQMEAASLAIRDLFPKIPAADIKAIIKRAFKEVRLPMTLELIS